MNMTGARTPSQEVIIDQFNWKREGDKSFKSGFGMGEYRKHSGSKMFAIRAVLTHIFYYCYGNMVYFNTRMY